MGLIVPAVLPSSRENFADTISRYERIPSVSRIQIDVVDGRFASPKSWPYTVPHELERMLATGEMLPHLGHIDYEIDLMCLDAEPAAGRWLSLGASRLTFHAESIISLPTFLASVKKRYGDASITLGLALQVGTDPVLIESCLGHIDYVQYMGIASIGKQGQRFDRRVLDKVRAFRARYTDMPLQVDGGVSLFVAQELIALGVSDLVVGSALLVASDPAAELEKFQALQASLSM